MSVRVDGDVPLLGIHLTALERTLVGVDDARDPVTLRIESITTCYAIAERGESATRRLSAADVDVAATLRLCANA
jgi:hypothetical protein